MIWLSIITVFGTLALVIANVTSQTPSLELGAGLVISGPVPWLLLAVLWGGLALGAASLVRDRRLPKLAVVALELAPVLYLSWYVVAGAPAGASTLLLDVGDAFPAYALEDQDRELHRRVAGDARPPALYIFYRGHW